MRLGSLGLPELLIILLVVLLIFGPRRLPDMAKGLGQSVREFRKGVRDMKDDFETEPDTQPGRSASARKAPPPASAEASQATAAHEASGDAVEDAGTGSEAKEA